LSETLRLGGDPPSPWEGQYGYSRVVAAEGVVFIGGTTSVSPDGMVVGETPYEQAVEILRKIAHEVVRGGASIGDVVQVRIYVTDISRHDEVGRALGETFGEIRPVATMVEVTGLIDPRMVVEIEALAITGSGRAS
jgi:enamine deaminase RidA (YjgF/YER057c/UK114 family)